MTEKEYAQVIAKNLKRIAFEKDKTQAQIAQELHVHRATISAWMNGTRYVFVYLRGKIGTRVIFRDIQLKNHAKCKIVVDNLRIAWYYIIKK